MQAGSRGLSILAACVPLSVRELHLNSNSVGGSAWRKSTQALVRLLLRLAPIDAKAGGPGLGGERAVALGLRELSIAVCVCSR